MNEHEIELIDYLRVLWRQKWLILATVVAALLAAWGATSFTESYRVEHNLLILEPPISQLEPGASDLHLGPRTYAEIATSSIVFEGIRSAIDGSLDREGIDLSSIISVSVESLAGDTGSDPQYFVSAKLRHTDPELLIKLSKSWSEAFSFSVGELFKEHASEALSQSELAYTQTSNALQKLSAERLEYLTRSELSILKVRRDSLQTELTKTYMQLADTVSEQNLLYSYQAEGVTSLSAPRVTWQIAAGEPLSATSTINALILGIPLPEFGKILAQNIANLAAQANRISTDLLSVSSSVEEIELSLSKYDRDISVLKDFAASKALEIQVSSGLLSTAGVQIIELTSQSSPQVSSQSTGLRTHLLLAGFLGILTGILLAFFIDYLLQVNVREKAQASDSSKEKADLGSDSTDEALH